MNRIHQFLVTCSLLALSVGGQAQQDASYFVKHLQFSGSESVDQKAAMAARLVPSPQQLAWQQMELTAFLHLDLENLGSTDVSIRMKDKNVKTNFYIADDASYDLIEKHLPVLEKRLAQKGYRCSITMSKEEKKVEFVEDFLQRDMPQAGTLHRYSFDVRA